MAILDVYPCSEASRSLEPSEHHEVGSEITASKTTFPVIDQAHGAVSKGFQEFHDKYLQFKHTTYLKQFLYFPYT